jgi:thiol-disulfide isomerase/thioredoxin
MIQIKRVIAIGLLCFALGASAQKTDNIIIIEGHFFSVMPVSSSEIEGFAAITTSQGTRAFTMKLKNPLPEKALKYALPAEEIPEAEELLERARTTKIRSTFVVEPTQPKVSAGDTFPPFTATDIEGRTWSNADVKGKPMVLNLWFTGCGPCRAEMPELSKWKEEMPGVMFFSATYETAEKARPVLEAQGFNWTHLVDDTQFSKWIDTTGYPMTILVNKDGIITYVEHGTSPVQREELKEKIQNLMQE